MKKYSFTIIKLLATLTLVLSVCTVVRAATIDDYTVLAPLPGTTKCGDSGGTGCKTDLPTYLPGLFNLTIGVAGILAFIMITFGGVLYMTSDAITGKSQGKEYIENALWGLLLVIGSWVILNTINPALLSFNLSVPPPTTVANSGLNVVPSVGNTGTPMTLGESDMEALLTGYGIGTSGNTTVAGLTDTTVSNLIALSNALGCNSTGNSTQSCVTVTGGTEGGHTPGGSHSTGSGVDIQETAALDNLIRSQGTPGPSSGGCDTITYNGATYLYEVAGQTCGGTVPSSGTHWHVTVGQ